MVARIVFLLLALGASCAASADTFNKFGAATGVLKGTASTYVTTAAASSDIYALWSGSCTAAKFLRGDGACSAVTLTSDVSGILPAANGGTGNGFTAFSGPASSTKTFTLPNSSATVLTDNATVTAAQGGTGNASYAAGDLLYASGTTALSKLAAGTSSQYLAGGTTPAWTTLNTSETDAAYVGTATWDSTPPSGSTDLRYSWQKQGAVVVFSLRLEYSVAGTTNSTVTATLPAGMPTPTFLTGVGTAEMVKVVDGALSTSASTISNLSKGGYLLRDGSGGFNLVVALNSGTISAKVAYFSGTYFTAP